MNAAGGIFLVHSNTPFIPIYGFHLAAKYPRSLRAGRFVSTETPVGSMRPIGELIGGKDER